MNHEKAILPHRARAKKQVTLICIGLVFGISFLSAQSPISKPTWKSKAKLPTARYSLKSLSVNNLLLVIGGSNGSLLTTVEAYDPRTDKWTAKAPLPAATQCLGAVAVGKKAYVLMDGENWKTKGCLFEYDLKADHWKKVSEQPTLRTHLAMTALEGRIYLIGGLVTTDEKGGFKNTDAVEAFDPPLDCSGQPA